MNKKILKAVSSDRLILVNAKELMSRVDVDDLRCRNSQTIQNFYHKEWFFEFKGEPYFDPPAIYINQGIIKFINGRHRSILLSRHLDEFPLLVGNLDLDHFSGVASTKSRDVLDKITAGSFIEHSFFHNMPKLAFGDFAPA